MNLALVIENLSASDTRTIVAKRPWTETSEAQLVSLTAECRVPSDVLNKGFEYFLEVEVAVNEVLGKCAGHLSSAQRFSAVLYYAENDAFPAWLNEIG